MAVAEKEQAVSEMSKLFSQSQAAFVVDYTKCTCAELTSLRRKLKPAGAKFGVVKNTLARRAIADTSAAPLSPLLKGQAAIIWSEQDPVTPAKVLVDFAKVKEEFKIKGGVVEGVIVAAAEVEALSKMPSREEILSKLLALLNAPATRLLQTLNAPASSLVRLLEAWRAEKEKTGK